jgi:cytochrome P450
MIYALFVLTGIFSLVWILTFVIARRFQHLPNGPIPLPILGNALQLDNNFLPNSLASFAIKYGPVCLFYVGKTPIALLSSPEAVHEVLDVNHNLCNAREPMPLGEEFGFDKGSGLNNNSDQWLATRKLTSHGLLIHLNRFVAENLEKELKLLVQSTEKAFFRNAAQTSHDDFEKVLIQCIFRYMWTIQIGGKCTQEEIILRSKRVQEAFDSFSVALSPANTAMIHIPLLCHLFPYTSQGKLLRQVLKNTVELFDEAYEEHVNNVDREVQKDFLDHAISVQRELGLEKANIVQTTIEAFLGGSDTTITTVTWVMMYLAYYPEVQEKVLQELEKIVGGDGCPRFFHMERLKYLDCVVREVLRIRPSVPMGLPRKAMGDIVLKSGQVIPKGSAIMTNNWFMGKDSKNWKNPEMFVPERFMNEESTVKLKSTEVREVDAYKFIPFGAGKRACTGYPLGKLNVKLTVAVLVWNFEWSLRNKADLSPHQRGLVLVPKFAKDLFPSSIRRQC